MRNSESSPAALVRKILAQYPHLSTPVTTAIASLSREAFCRDVAPDDIKRAYEDQPILIPGSPGHSAPLSQPSVVALMLHALAVRRGNRVLEVGAGSGYAAALLSELAGPDAPVTTVEIDPVLAEKARDNLRFVGKTCVNMPEADASLCPPALADSQFDRVLLSASVRIPPEWIIRSLSGEGIIVFPLDMLMTRPGWPCFVAKLQRNADALQGGFITSLVQGWESLRCAPDAREVGAHAVMKWDANGTYEMFQRVQPGLWNQGPPGCLIYLLGKIEAAFQSGRVHTLADCHSWLDDVRWQEINQQWVQEGSPGPESFILCLASHPKAERYQAEELVWARRLGEQVLCMLL